MMGHREVLKSGDERDVVSKRARQMLIYLGRPGVRRAIKRRLSRRVRRSVRRTLHGLVLG